MSRLPVRTVAGVLATLLAAVLLAACGQGGASSQPTPTASPSVTPTARPTLPPKAVKALVARHKRSFVKTARAFQACDKKVAYDSYHASPCLKQANALTASVDTFLGDLRAITLPPGEQDVLVKDLATMSEAGATVAVKCKKANDQVCDQALARFRADLQSILWDLDASL